MLAPRLTLSVLFLSVCALGFAQSSANIFLVLSMFSFCFALLLLALW